MKNLKTNGCEDDTLHEECGVFGVYDFDGADVAFMPYSIEVKKAVELQ